MRRKIYLATLVLVLSVLSIFYVKDVKAAYSDGIYGELNKTEVFTEVGETTKLKLLKTRLKPDSWKSSNHKVAKVDKKGNVKALKPGKATITLKYSNSDWIYTRTCEFEVVKKKIKIIKPDLPVTVHRGSGDRLYVTTKVHRLKVETTKDKIKLEAVVEKVESNNWEYGEAKFQFLDEDDIAVYEDRFISTMQDGEKKRLTATVDIKGELKHGKTYRLVFVDNGYVPAPDEKDDGDGEAVKEESVKIELRAVPFIKNNLTYSNEIESSFRIDKLTYTSSGNDVKLLFEIEKFYDRRGAGQSDVCKIGWKLYDSKGYVVKSGTAYSESLKMGDKTRMTESIYRLKKDESYRLEILDVN